MNEIFKTVLILSLFGFIISAILLLLKPVTAKKFPAKWQYYVWIAVLVSMMIPAYKLIPEGQVQKIRVMTQSEVFVPQAEVVEVQEPETNEFLPQATNDKVFVSTSGAEIKAFDIITYVWILGIAVFLLVVFTSYIIYLVKRKKNSLAVKDNEVLEEVKSILKIRRSIRVRISPDVASPMLVGVLFPIVYIPCKEIPDHMMRMVFLHELTHYKRKDLIIKWFALLVNAVHWFNPISYLISANLSEACEISCDMEVTKNMEEEEQKLYMKTILELVE